MGEEKATALFNDSVHTTPEGAEFNAQAVVEGIEKLEGSVLKNYLSKKAGAPAAGASPGSDWSDRFKRK